MGVPLESDVVSSSDGPIGIFDSGFGGLTVARSVVDQMPNEDVLYLGDTARAPYGTKSLPEVREYALECLDRLVDHDVKALVIACNSASSAVLRDARERYSVPVVDVVLPAARRAVRVSRNGRIGVICTSATAYSRSYDDALAAVPDVELFTSPCPLFVDFVEAGVTGGPDLEAIAHDYLEPLRLAGIDTLILGCTHYPLLTGVINYVLGDTVTLVSSAEECAKAYELAAKYDAEVLCEEFITGDETTCPVLGTGANARALPVIRIVAPEGNYDYQNKYFTDTTQYHCPSGLPAAEEAEIQRIVEKAFRTLGCRGWARADIMIRASDRKPFLLEINTSPGMTGHSLVPMAARASGISYENLCLGILAMSALDGEAKPS